MTNRYDFGTMKLPQGWIAWYRRIHEAENTILRRKSKDIIFATELEALKAAKEEHLKYVNCPVIGAMMEIPSVKDARKATANSKLFSKGRVIEIERKAGAA